MEQDLTPRAPASGGRAGGKGTGGAPEERGPGRSSSPAGAPGPAPGVDAMGGFGTTEEAGSEPRLPLSPGLDGLRAVAVLAVIAFHNFAWLPGGYYGVDTFFVLSGYLITSLLVVEWRSSGTVRLGRFWARRARRLLPALLVLVAGLGVLVVAWPGALDWPSPLSDAAATLGYVANWHFVVGGSSYFAASTPQSPLLHTWSLAIEEQFYLIWPLVVLGVLGGFGAWRRRVRTPASDRRRLGALGVLCVVGALASAAWMWVLTPTTSDISRSYYGTDTRAQALLVGAALAVALPALARTGMVVRRLGAVVGVVGLAGLALVFHLVPETSTLAFHGGFLLASLAAGAVVTGVVLAPIGPAARLLSPRPVRYLGRISYGVYLWYWPVTLVITGERTQLGQWPLFLVRTAVTVALAAASARLVELPIRRHRLPAWRALVGAPLAAGLSLTLLGVATTTPSTALVPPPAARAVVPPATKAAGAGPGAPAPPPVRLLVVGDSMAGSLAAALAYQAPAYDVEVVNEGHPGCGLSTDANFRFYGQVVPPGAPCRVGQPDALVDQWRDWVGTYRPDVVIYLARADLFDQDRNGAWTWIGHPAYDRFLEHQLRTGLAVLTSGGAHVMLMTSPYYDSTVSGAAPPMPEDAPGRVALDDGILRSVAASTPGTSVFPLGRVVTPEGQYQQDVDGTDVRCSDGVHFTLAAGQVVAPALLPAVVRLGRTAPVPPLAGAGAGPTVARATLPPPAVPAWYGHLHC